MKSKGIIYLLWLVSFFGWLGFQHFYLGKYVKGIIWILTGGVFGIGSLVDLFTMGSAVENYNTKIELQTIRTAALSNLTRDQGTHQTAESINNHNLAVQQLKTIIDENISKNPDCEKSFIDETLEQKQKEKISKKFKPINLNFEKILFAGLYSSMGIMLGIIFTDRNIYFRVSSGMMGFLETKSLPLNQINTLDIGYGLGKGIINKQETGADLVINGQTVGSFTGFTLPDNDEKLLKGMFAELSQSGVLKNI